jgi:hypothetical protein
VTYSEETRAYLEEVRGYAQVQERISERAGQLAARRLWGDMAGTAQQLITMLERIAESVEGGGGA